MEQIKDNLEKLSFPLAIIASALVLSVTSLHSYTLFHTSIELFSVVIAFGIFVIAWASRHFVGNKFLLIFGIGYLFIGSLDLLHTLSYAGVGIIKGSGAISNLPTQLWIAARYLEAASILAALIFLKESDQKKTKTIGTTAYKVLLSYTIIFLFLLGSIFYWKNFPVSYIDGTGLTAFKKISEYIISSLFLISIALLFKKSRLLDREMAGILAISFFVKIASEISFTEYFGVYDFSNMLGHLFKFISFLLLYKAVLELGLMKPYSLLFSDLQKSEERYRSLVDFSPDSIVVHIEGKIVYANGPTIKLFGVKDKSEIIGKDLASFFQTDFQNLVRTRINKVIEGKYSRTPLVELEITRPDGKNVIVEMKGEKITYVGKVAMESIIRDISKRKQAEEKIRSLAKFPEENPSPVLRTLSDGRVQYCNLPARKMLISLGWHNNALLPQPLLSAVQHIQETGKKQYELEIVCPSKRIFSMLLASSATEGWVNLYGRDITERRRVEEELATTQLELKKRIEEQLSESYTYLGLVNRKISILLEMESHAHGKNSKQEIFDYILNSAVSISRAKLGFLYITSDKDHFNLISLSGLDKAKVVNFKSITDVDAGFINKLIKERRRMNGTCELADCGRFKDGFEMSYFVALPILLRNRCEGFLFLGFAELKSMDADELQFLDVFSNHVSLALSNAGIL